MTTSRARRALAELLSGTSIVHAVAVAASLGIADLLEQGPRTVRDLARRTRTHEDSLFRLMRALAGVGVFARRGGRFALTPLSRLLRTRAAGSMRSIAAFAHAPSRRAAFGLSNSVRTGKPAFDQEFGRPFYDYLDAHPPERRLFADVMTYHWEQTGAAILGAYDFSSARTIVDVGGGTGAMMAAILRRNAAATGIVVETRRGATETRRYIRRSGLAGRCRVVGGDFFDRLPQNADLYVLSFVLHNWSDADAIRILRNCRRAIASNGRLLILETPLEAGAFAEIHDLEMLVYMPGGRERTVAEYRRLCETAGLALRRVIGTRATAVLIEARARPSPRRKRASAC